MSSDGRIAAHRALWSMLNEQHTDEDSQRRWAAGEMRWGLFSIPESELRAIGDVEGSDVLELGAGTAYVSASLARSGATVTALDLSHHQLCSARRRQLEQGPVFPLVEADAAAVPLRDRSFDLVVSEYGAAPWCDPEHWLPEAARVLRPHGRLVFLTNSVLAAMCVPAEGGVAGDRLLRGPDALDPVIWPGGGTEHHLGHGEWIRLLADEGFVVEALHELRPLPGAPEHGYYEIVGADWAERWPAEDLWVARLGR